MKIGILQAGHLPPEMNAVHGTYGDLYPALLHGQGFTFRTYSVVDLEFPASPADCDGWLISGSRHGAYEDLPFIAPLMDFIRAVYAADVPLVGICFGHQIIARALGGEVRKFEGGWSIGRQVYDFDGQPMALNAWHQDQVVRKPEDAQVCATSEFCENAALVYGHKAYSIQAHPEFTPAFTADLIEARGRGVVPEPLIAQAQGDIAKPVDNGAIAARIGRFFRTRAAA